MCDIDENDVEDTSRDKFPRCWTGLFGLGRPSARVSSSCIETRNGRIGDCNLTCT
jgi:hypothetical protein